MYQMSKKLPASFLFDRKPPHEKVEKRITTTQKIISKLHLERKCQDNSRNKKTMNLGTKNMPP